MDTAFRLALTTHIASGTVCVLAGVFPVLGAKGGSWHKQLGRVFVRSMMVVVGTAVFMTILRPSAYFAGLTASAALAGFSGFRVLGRKRPDLRPADRATPLDWLVTALAIAVALWLAAAVAVGSVTRNLPVVFALSGGTLAYALYDVRRFAAPTAFPFSPNLWLYEHLVKMLGSYFAAVAAFSGSVLVLLPEPWRQLWATSLGQLLAVVFVLYYRRRFARGRGTPRAPVSHKVPSP